MPVTTLNPAELPPPEGYAQVTIAAGNRFVFISGQVARDSAGTQVGAGDLAAQTEQALRNVNAAVVAAGGTFADVAKLTLYVVDWTPDKMQSLGEGVGRAMGDLGIDPIKAATLVGVATLAEPDLLIEIEAIAVVDH